MMTYIIQSRHIYEQTDRLKKDKMKKQYKQNQEQANILFVNIVYIFLLQNPLRHYSISSKLMLLCGKVPATMS